MTDLWNINILKSIYWSWNNERDETPLEKIKDILRKRYAVLVYPKVNFRSQGGRLVVGRRLILGVVWPLSSYRISDLRLFSSGTLKVEEKFKLFSGFHISVYEGAVLSLGSGYANYDLRIDCKKKVQIGHNVAISHGVKISDSDSHVISGQSDNPAPVVIGDHVWLGMNSIVLKGVHIGDGSVVARDVPSKVLVAGVSAKVIRRDIEWHK